MPNKLLNTPKVIRKKFAKHFLNSVHSEISFAGTAINTILGAEGSLKDFFQSEGFDITKRFMQNEVMLKGREEGEKSATISHKEKPVGLVFSSQKPRIDVQLLDNKLVISDFNYQGFEEFNARFKRIYDGVLKFVPCTDIKKIGLRKINSVAIEPVASYQDACAIFNPALFAILRSGLIQNGALKDHEEITVIEKDSMRAILRARMRKTSENAYESTLDFDFVDLAPTSWEHIFTKKLPELNDYHFELFMWSASSELINLMEEK